MLRNLILAAIFCSALAGASYGQKYEPETKPDKEPPTCDFCPADEKPIYKEPKEPVYRESEKPIEKPDYQPSDEPMQYPLEQNVWKLIEAKIGLPIREIR